MDKKMLENLLFYMGFIALLIFLIAMFVVNWPEPDHAGNTNKDFKIIQESFKRNLRQDNIPTNANEIKSIVGNNDVFRKFNFWKKGASFNDLDTRTEQGRYLVQIPAGEDSNRINVHYYNFEEMYWMQRSYFVGKDRISVAESEDVWEEENGIACREKFVEDCYYFAQ